LAGLCGLLDGSRLEADEAERQGLGDFLKPLGCGRLISVERIGTSHEPVS
jgi:hypothetical protein